MSFVSVEPDALRAAAGELNVIAGRIEADNATAALRTTAVVGPGSEEVSAAMATRVAAYTEAYQRISAEGVTILQRFADELVGVAAAYSDTEDTNGQSLK